MTSDRHNHSDTKQANCQIKYRLVQVIVILKAREPARIMTAIGDKKLNRWHLQVY